MARTKKKIADIAEDKKLSLWNDRILTKEVPIQDATFIIQTISSDISLWIESKALKINPDTQEAELDNFIQNWYFCKFSIKDFKGLKNNEGKDIEPEYETIQILHTKYDCLSDDCMKNMRPLTIKSLFSIAQMMSWMNEEDIVALDFTTPSPTQKSNATPTANEPIEKPGEENKTNLEVLSND